MDWNRAIEIKRAALSRIVAAFIAMVGLVEGGVLGRIPKPLYRAVVRVLFPAESAVRRLIVVAARGLKVDLPPSRPMPKGLAFAARGSKRLSFQLFDTRKRFDRVRRKGLKVVPRIHVFVSSPLVPLFRPRPVEAPVPEPDTTIDAARLGRRLAAIKMALETLPCQAKRMARLKARRARIQRPTFKSPLRPGPPPGDCRMAGEEVDFVLREYHVLAWDALKLDTS